LARVRDAGFRALLARRSADLGALVVRTAIGDDFGAHSLRAGFLTSAARRGASVFKMRDVSRHKSMDVLRPMCGMLNYSKITRVSDCSNRTLPPSAHNLDESRVDDHGSSREARFKVKDFFRVLSKLEDLPACQFTCKQVTRFYVLAVTALGGRLTATALPSTSRAAAVPASSAGQDGGARWGGVAEAANSGKQHKPADARGKAGGAAEGRALARNRCENASRGA
jgi:hypothetical protein